MEIDRERLREEEAIIIRALEAIGISVESVSDLARKHAPLDRRVLDLLLHTVNQVDTVNLHEMIVRAIGASRCSYDASPLLRLFEGTDSAALKWAIANTLAVSKPRGVGLWAVRAFGDPKSGQAREMLAHAVAKHAPRQEARTALLAQFDEFPGHAASAMSKIATREDVAFLESKCDQYNGWIRRAIQRTIANTNTRLAKSAR